MGIITSVKIAVCGPLRTRALLAVSVLALSLGTFGAPVARAAAYVPNEVVVGYAPTAPKETPRRSPRECASPSATALA